MHRASAVRRRVPALRAILATLGIATSIVTTSGARVQQTPSIADLLDTYAAGDFDAAVKAGAARRDLPRWESAFPTAARAWIARAPDDTARRRLAAAGFILEVTRERYERDEAVWRPLRGVVEWACAELRRDSSRSEGEHAWQRASTALGQRVGDVTWLLPQKVGTQSMVEEVNHLSHTRQRFPADSRFLLAAVVAETWHGDTDIRGRERLQAARYDPIKESHIAITAFTTLVNDPDVGAEAELHVSHLHLMLHAWDVALEHARTAIGVARDDRVRYLGFVIAGMSLESLGRSESARNAYTQALDALPDGQTALLRLATLLHTTEPIERVALLARRSVSAAPVRDDPWRLYYYGDYMHWPTYIAQVHAALR